MIPTDYDNGERRLAGAIFLALLAVACLFVATGGKCVTAFVLLPLALEVMR